MDLVKCYVKFCRLRQHIETSQELDLTDETFMYPTTFTPLLAYLTTLDPDKISIKVPKDEALKNYMLTILRSAKTGKMGGTYIPFIPLPEEKTEADKILAQFWKLVGEDDFIRKNYQSLDYILDEFVSNIYEHSQFKNAYVMAQKYPNLGYVELCVVDDGVTIPGSFNIHGYSYKEEEHPQAIMDALNGKSTKGPDYRGFGLRTSANIIYKGFKGELLVVSNLGAVNISQKRMQPYILQENMRYEGTLIAVRVPLIYEKVNLYDYI